LIGTTFAAVFESLVLGASAGVRGETMFEVFGSSGVSSPLFKGCSKLIMERKFKDTGSQIATMYKDLGITMNMAKAFETKIVRTMSFRKEMIIFGYNGAEDWNASRGAWDKLIELLTPAVRLAEENDITLSVETGNNAMITSAVLARKFIDDMGSDNLKLMWDPANTLYCGEVVYPDGFDALRGGYISHVHMKDCRVDIPGAAVWQCEMGTGEMAPYLEAIAAGLREENFDGVVSLESVYHPDGGTYEDGFRASVGRFKELFG
jgi:sugar phosphate isomerase/epimerase